MACGASYNHLLIHRKPDTTMHRVKPRIHFNEFKDFFLYCKASIAKQALQKFSRVHLERSLKSLSFHDRETRSNSKKSLSTRSCIQ